MSTDEQTLSAFSNERATVSDINSNAAFSRRRVVVEGTSSWQKKIDQRFNELTSLRHGWDGYSGLPVSFSIAKFASIVLARICTADTPTPALVPGSDGTLQIEWHRNGFDIELDVHAANNVVATRFCCETDEEEYLEISTDFTVPAQWVAEMTAGNTGFAKTATR